MLPKYFMQIPLFSTITLAMEFLIGVLIFFVIYKGYKKKCVSRKASAFRDRIRTYFQCWIHALPRNGEV